MVSIYNTNKLKYHHMMEHPALAGLLLTFTLWLASGFVDAGIVGSAHDFSSQNWSNGEICIVCHVPHNANGTTGTTLWARSLPTTTYQLYQSPYDPARGSIYQHGAIQQPGVESLMCLSCHDGTIAVDSYGSNTGGSVFVTGKKLIGTDLSNDHPIGVEWLHQTVWENSTATCTKCHIDIPMSYYDMPLPFFKTTGRARVECATCHDPHNSNNNAKLLRKNNSGSGLCLHCHDN